MSKLTYSIGKDSLIVPVLIGLDGKTTADLYSKGLPIAAPVDGPAGQFSLEG